MINKSARVLSIGVILTLLFGLSSGPRDTQFVTSGYKTIENSTVSKVGKPISIKNKEVDPSNSTVKIGSVEEGIPSEKGMQSEDLESSVVSSSRLVVKLRPGTEINEIAQSIQAEILREGPLDYVTLTVPSERAEEVINALGRTPGVLSVNPARQMNMAELTSPRVTEPYYSEQWGLSKAEVQKAWGLGATGAGITIATIDTGVDVTHPDLKNNLVEGYNAITGKTGLSAVQDNNGHGTHVAGIAAAALNGEGIVGVAYQAKIMPIKAMNRSGEGTDDIVADGIIWAADHGAQIINLSLGANDETDILKDAIQYAQRKGALLIAAAGNIAEGNTGTTSITFPAADPGVLAVTATDNADSLASFSLTGPQAGLAAPGVNIVSDYWQNRSGYATTEGTSMASPFVAGVAALVWSLHPELTAEQVKVLLENSALDLGTPGRDKNYGFGRVDAYWAVKFAATPEDFSSPANLSWAGGRVQEETGQASSTKATLTVPPRAFGIDPAKSVPVQVKSMQDAPEFPQGVIPVGDGVLIQWDSSSQKNLTLTVLLQSEEISQIKSLSPDKAQLAYLYHWTGTRWLKVGGGVDLSEITQGITAGITEPGIYRVGLEAFPEDNRIAGEDRIQTAVQISQANFQTGADTVLLARSDDFPDALAGAPLAYKYHAPILLTEVNALPDSVWQELKRLNPRKIILLGGTGAISTSIEAELQALAPVKRIGGANRFATASEIAEELGMLGEAVLVNGNNYPDAISMSAIAAQKGIPILLTDTNSLPPETDATLRKYSVSQTEIIGGEGVVSSRSLKALPSPTRLAGIDRYATAAAVLQAYPSTGRLIYLATGENFPDALTGGVVAALNNSRIILVPPTGPSDQERRVLEPWSGRSTLVFGGSRVVPEEVVDQIQSWVQ